MGTTSLQAIYNLTSQINRLKENTIEFKNKMDGKPQEYVDIAVQKFSLYVSNGLNEVRDIVVNFARSHYCACSDIMEPLQPLVDFLENIFDLGSVINAVKAIIEYLIGPYYKAIKAQADLVIAVAQLSAALISAVAVIVDELSDISPGGVDIQIDPITLSEITNCPVEETVVGDFDNYPTLA